MGKRDDTPAKHVSLPARQKGGAVIDARIGKAVVNKVGDAIEREPVRAAEVLRGWLNQRH